jgi:hypothetical protein
MRAGEVRRQAGRPLEVLEGELRRSGQPVEGAQVVVGDRLVGHAGEQAANCSIAFSYSGLALVGDP